MKHLLKNGCLALMLIALFSCNVDSSNFTLKGKIKGLKKGVVYLQKEVDTTIINLDSLEIKGQQEFTLSTNLEEPMVLYLSLQKNDGKEHYVPFFANMGEMEINTTLDGFNFDADIKGSKQQDALNQYLKLMKGFNQRNLELLEENFNAMKDNNIALSDSLQEASQTLFKRKYATTINFALNHTDNEIAPYLALYEIPNATKKYIDTIYNSLTPEIKASYYGRELKEAMARRDSL
ncbi:DUF4369 domain-containing protein [Winogradskyella maritima]|uniref:DUF4369 domain-containing protein n=1 Tax=Winogradskyella maritima TaxID=1517766 RepID=A0ABV8AL06_9FLAO|nr:DUF4369 domain-containing protein [Winogradskyella maritima]